MSVDPVAHATHASRSAGRGLGKQVGPFPLGVWALILAGGVGLTYLGRRRSAQQSAAALAATNPGPTVDNSASMIPNDAGVTGTGGMTNAYQLGYGYGFSDGAGFGLAGSAGTDPAQPVTTPQSDPYTTKPLAPVPLPPVSTTPAPVPVQAAPPPPPVYVPPPAPSQAAAIVMTPESQWTPSQRNTADAYGLPGSNPYSSVGLPASAVPSRFTPRAAVAPQPPLPRRNATTDRSITSIPESQWTARQRQYADMYGLAGSR